MSLAYKLWRIGGVLTREDMKGVIRINPDSVLKPGEEPEYINLDFRIDAQENTTLTMRQSAVSKESMFFTKKLGGSGSGIYYLYPNLVLRLTEKQSIASKLPLLVNTVKNSVLLFTKDKNNSRSQTILDYFEEQTEDPVLKSLNDIKGGSFWFWISINGQTLPDLMSEVWENWFNTPVTKVKEAGPGYDSFSGKEAIVGFRTEFKIFSYDQYHDSLNHRVSKNLPLSLESAGKIKLAWIYILSKLVFFYKGLEYLILPNLIMDDKQALREIIESLVTANAMTKKKPKKLQALRREEKKILKSLKKRHGTQDGKNKEMEKAHEQTIMTIDALDTGFLTEVKEQADYLGDLKNAVTLDLIFTDINRTNLSFEINGAIEDVVPSRLSEVVNEMRTQELDDNITLTAKKKDKIYLQDFFNRDELYFVLNKTQQQNNNRILQERLYLARLLLTDATISLENLLARFEFNREYDYAHKKRVTNGVRDWINYPATYVRQESKIISFFKNRNKQRSRSMPEEKNSFNDYFLMRKDVDTTGYYEKPAIQKAYFIGAYAKAVINSSFHSKVSRGNTTFKNWLSNQIINYRNLDRIFEMAFRYEQKLKLNIRNHSEVRKLAHETPESKAAGMSSAKISYAFVAGFDDYSKHTKTEQEKSTKKGESNE